MKRLLALGAVLAVGVTGCSSGGTQTVTQPGPAATTPTVPAPDVNQQIADQYAKVAPKELAAVCDFARTAPAQAHKMAAHILGSQIIQSGGNVDAVIGDLLERC